MHIFLDITNKGFLIRLCYLSEPRGADTTLAATFYFGDTVFWTINFFITFYVPLFRPRTLEIQIQQPKICPENFGSDGDQK